MRKSHPAVSSPGLFASPWPTVAARARDNKTQTPGQHTLHEGGKPCNTIRFAQARNAPAAKPAQARLSPSSLTFLHLGRPTVVPRSSTGMDNMHILHHYNRPVSNVCRRGARQHTRRVSD